MSKNRQTYVESGANWKLTVYHYPILYAHISFAAIFIACIVTSMVPGFILIDFVLFPSLAFLIYKTYKEKTIYEKSDLYLEITKQKVFDSDHKKFTLQGIKGVVFAEQTYSERDVLGTIFIYNIMGPKKVYSQQVVGIQTGLTLYRTGQDFTEETIVELKDFLKEKLGK